MSEFGVSSPFDRWKSRFRHIINPDHFLGRSAFDIPWSKKYPLANIKKNGKIYEIELLVPGFSKDELEVHIDRGILIVSGVKRTKVVPKDGEYILEEFDLESFERRFTLSSKHTHHRVEAFFEDGLLRIIFYFKEDPVATEYKRIAVEEP